MTERVIEHSITASYIVASVLFIVGLKRLSSPATARSGNLLAAVGMLIAVVATLLNREIIEFQYIVIGLVVGSGIGVIMARMVKMTAMPQMVAVFNGFGGAASSLVAADELLRLAEGGAVPVVVTVTGLASTIIGTVTFSGSMIAFGKLQGFVPSPPVLLPARNLINATLGIAAIGFAAWGIATPAAPEIPFTVASVLALALGVLLVIPIGGADMPVVIALLNSYSGLAAAATGFVLDNDVLIISGALVGASGIILTRIMTRAMNRSMMNVVFGGFGAVTAAAPVLGAAAEKPYRSASAEDAATVLRYARNVIVVPGYGLAVAQAQHGVKLLADLLKDRGVSVKYAIHPVAGRMPGHMNVLLAEANVPYDELYDMDQINDEFARADVAVVIGANDVVNPAARHDTASPLYGMPILNADKAAQVLVLKRSMAPGFSGVDNELFYLPNTMMLFGDAQKSVTALAAAVKQM
ncbi:MAG: NAD(P)(+) transhydrogenase (Re/Si-specific) subunit beta [Chloroflexi bacterium]|nr:NAD(P)(+) transhydrogenase (Re/Si-specific) subunit beta [Chloroflexota bacterium]